MGIPALASTGADTYVAKTLARASNTADTAAIPAQPSEKPAQEVSKEATSDAVKKANAAIQNLRSDLQFSVDQDTGLNVVKVVDINTKEVIRQMPAQEMLDVAKHLDELRGLLIKEKA